MLIWYDLNIFNTRQARVQRENKFPYKLMATKKKRETDRDVDGNSKNICNI